MTDLELALAGDDLDLSSYLENVPTDDFRREISALILRHESQDVKTFKEKIKLAIDSI